MLSPVGRGRVVPTASQELPAPTARCEKRQGNYRKSVGIENGQSQTLACNSSRPGAGQGVAETADARGKGVVG
jgi:hypothetical protein